VVGGRGRNETADTVLVVFVLLLYKLYLQYDTITNVRYISDCSHLAKKCSTLNDLIGYILKSTGAKKIPLWWYLTHNTKVHTLNTTDYAPLYINTRGFEEPTEPEARYETLIFRVLEY
jgi:hypothetical protein